MTGTTRRCASPADLIAVVTEMLGYCPSDSLVLLPLEGNSGGATLRFDLPDRDATIADLDGFAGAVLGYAMHLEETDAIACLVFVDDEVASAPRLEVVGAIDGAAMRMGLRMLTPLYRARNGWGAYRPVGNIPSTGPQPLSMLGPSALLAPSPPPRASLSPAGDDVSVSTEATRLDGGDRRTILERLLAEPCAVVHPDDADEVFGALGEACSFRSLRDEILAVIAFGDDWNSALAVMRGHVFLGDDADDYDASSLRRAFDPDRCERAIPLLREVARRTAGRQRGMVLSAIAWLCWSLGQGTATANWAERSLALDPDNTLARLLFGAASVGVIAPWFGKAPRRVGAQHDAA